MLGERRFFINFSTISFEIHSFLGCYLLETIFGLESHLMYREFIMSTCIAGVRFSITQNVSYYIFISSFETLYFKKRQTLWIFWLNIAKIGASWVILELSQQLIFQLIHMGNRVTCIGVFNENIVCFWRFLRWNDQKWPKKYNNWRTGLWKISRQQYQWLQNKNLFTLKWLWDLCFMDEMSRNYVN